MFLGSVLLSTIFFSGDAKLRYSGCARRGQRVGQLVDQMTLEEKVGQIVMASRLKLEEFSQGQDIVDLDLGAILSGGGEVPESNTVRGWRQMITGYQTAALGTPLGVPILYGIDAVHGHGNLEEATIFPHNIGLGAANDEDLMVRIGKAVAEEVRATGIAWNFSPAVSVPQDIRWGRTYEGFSESTDIVTKLALAYIQGQQEPVRVKGRTYPGVMTTVKHFLGDGATKWGTNEAADSTEGWNIDRGDAVISEQELRAKHMPPFKAAIDLGVQAVMMSFNSFQGVKMHGSKYWITEVLRKELGFDGLILSDWEGFFQLEGSEEEQVAQALEAGIDIFMGAWRYQDTHDLLLKVMRKGMVPMDRLDDAVRRVLEVKCYINLWDEPVPGQALVKTVHSPEHRAIAREAVRKSLVLLKNSQGALPLSTPQQETLVVAGIGAGNSGFQNGGWTYEWQGVQENRGTAVTLLTAAKNRFGADKVVYYDNDACSTPGSCSQASGAVCLQVVSEVPYAEGLGDKINPSVSDEELKLFDRLNSLCGKHVVVVYSGRPIDLRGIETKADALVAAWLPGSEGGPGILDVLMGRSMFQGKLSYTWPRNFNGYEGQGSLKPSDVLYPRGYGLDYRQ